VCTLQGRMGLSHPVLLPSTLDCKKCHCSKCFLHILKMYRVHSIEALLQHERDDTHQTYHDYHRNSKLNYMTELPSLLESQRQGSPPNFPYQRVLAALTYQSCKPINSAYMGLGWYDMSAQMHPVRNSVLVFCPALTMITFILATSRTQWSSGTCGIISRGQICRS
jgi:hypothetical protein